MSDNERFKNRLPFHPTFRRSFQVPVALLRHYRELDLKHSHLVFVLQVFSTYLNDSEASQAKIADWMQTDRRVVRQYSEHLQKLGLLDVTTRRKDGTQAENDYDLTPLLDAVLSLYEKAEEERRARAAEMADIVREIADAFESGQEVSEVLKRRVIDLRQRSLVVPPPPIYEGNGEGGKDDDEDDEDGGGGLTLIGKLERLGYDRRSASYLIHKAQGIFAEDTEMVVNGWLKEIREKGKKIRNPAGFLRTKLEGGDYPPEDKMDLPRRCRKCKREMAEHELMVGDLCLECSGLPINH